jgi:hypothetical protein
LSALSGLPELPMGGLGDREAVDLLSSITGGRLSPDLAGPVREASSPGWC